jgi:site-specific recombinase XerD
MASLQKKGKYWYAVFSAIDNNPDRKSKYKVVWKNTYTDSKALAKQRLVRMESDLQKGDLALTNHKITFKDYADRHYLPWAKANKGHSAYMSNVYSCAHAMKHFGNQYLSAISAYTIEQYKIKRKAEVKERTINIEIGCIKQLFRLAEEWGFVMKNPAKLVKKYKEPKGNPRFLNRDEIITLLEHSSEWLKMFIYFGLGAGLRYSEIISLRFECIDLERNVIKIKNDPENGFMVKNRKEREVPITGFLYKAILWFTQHWIDYSHDTVKERSAEQRIYFFCHADGSKVRDTKKAFARAVKRAGLKGVSPHTLRHTFASHLVMNGVDIKTVSEYLGHSSIKVTEIYLHLLNEHKQDSIKRLGYDSVFSDFPCLPLLPSS